MKKQTKDVDFRPEKPRIDLQTSSQRPTVQLIGSLSVPGGRSLVAPPTIDVNELLDGTSEVKETKIEPTQTTPLFHGDLFFAEQTAPKPKEDDTVKIESPISMTQEEFVRKQKMLKNRLSFERIDELTRPKKTLPGEWTKCDLTDCNPNDGNFGFSAPETKELDLPDWEPLPKLMPMKKKPSIPEPPQEYVFAETENEIMSIPLQTETNSSLIEPTEKRIFAMYQDSVPEIEPITTTTSESNVMKENESTIVLPLQRTEVPILQANDVRKSYSKGKLKIPVLNGVDFAACPSEFVSIVGQSGSGKSTLLHLLGTLDNPDSGTIYFEGRRIDDLPIAKRDLLRNRSIGFIFQFYHLLPELTTLENVLSPLMIRESVFGYLSKRRQYVERGKEILDRVGLSHRLKHRPNELSGGEMQRAAIARALVADPKILLADEPTGNLDSSSAGEIIEILRRLNEDHQLTIIMVTHDNIIAGAANRMVRMVDGMIVEEGSTTLEERLSHRIGS